ncbi:MAG: hypothetical protein RJA81_1936 [Planctomycetota bacterium]
MKKPKLVVIGLDSAAPELLFHRLAKHLPHLTRLRQGGQWGELRSCDPPITVPAWQVATTGLDPGELGCYGFRNRADHSYGLMATATSLNSNAPRVWDYLGQAGLDSILVGIPQTYPPKPVRGCLVADFLTPSIQSPYTWPGNLKEEIARLPSVHPYQFDVENFRSDDSERLKSSIWQMTRKRFALTRHLAISQNWDFLMMVEIGLDRVQHAFWEDWPEGLTDLESLRRDAPKLAVLVDYYRLLDQEIGLLLQTIPEPKTVMVLSDHGACAMKGGFALNQWLINRGDLVLKTPTKSPVKLEIADVDWSKTLAWGAGGFYGRIFLNIQGREPQGCLSPEDVESYVAGLKTDLEQLNGPDGKMMGNTVHRPQELYKTVNGIAPPDLIAYFGHLGWRSVGLVGLNDIFTSENDTGPDLANHDFQGCWIANGPNIDPCLEPLQDLHLIQFTATVLDYFGVKRPVNLLHQKQLVKI